MNPKHKRIFLGVFLIITPPALVLLSAAKSVAYERHVQDGRIPSTPYWDVLFPIALIACFFCIPAGAFIIYKAFSDRE